MPRFVILSHDHPHLHWDFMLEMEGKLRTWRLERLPAPGVGIRAEPLGDHRIAYLDYEGPVSGGRGSVTRWDAGEFEWGKNEPGEIFVGLRGSKLRGQARLTETNGDWEFVFRS